MKNLFIQNIAQMIHSKNLFVQNLTQKVHWKFCLDLVASFPSFHELFITFFNFSYGNALLPHSIIQLIVWEKYSFKEIIHSKTNKSYWFKELIRLKNENNLFEDINHSKFIKIIHSDDLFHQVKNRLSPRAIRHFGRSSWSLAPWRPRTFFSLCSFLQ